MKALILNSGEGKRLRPLTRYTPKALLKIGEKTLLGYQINSLIETGVHDLIITTGPFENKIKEFVYRTYPNVNVVYVKNPKYRTTNYIYSMWLTKERIDDDIILLHGDLFFDKRLLKKLIDAKYSNCVFVNKMIEPPDKDFKAVIRDNRVIKIGVGFYGIDVYFLAPMYKFSRLDFLYWLEEIENFIRKGKMDIYAETVFNEISDRIVLHSLYFDNEVCLEIDTKEDLKLARNLIKNKAIINID